MATPQLKEAEESIYDLLRTIRRRPGLSSLTRSLPDCTVSSSVTSADWLVVV